MTSLIQTRYQKIFSGYSFGHKNILNFICLTMKFHNYHHTNSGSSMDVLSIKYLLRNKNGPDKPHFLAKPFNILEKVKILKMYKRLLWFLDIINCFKLQEISVEYTIHILIGSWIVEWFIFMFFHLFCFSFTIVRRKNTLLSLMHELTTRPSTMSKT